MTVQEILDELKGYGNAGTKKVLMRHGAKEPFWGVKVGDMKKIIKKTKKNHELSLELFNTGNSDAMYLAGLIGDENKITKKDLNNWVKKAYWYFLSEYAVAAIAAESKHGFEMAMEWIESDKENIASSGWATLSGLMSIKQDEELDINVLSSLLDRIKNTIHDSKNRVRYTMNGFVIAAGAYVPALTSKASETAEAIGKVNVEMGGTACKVPPAGPYIQKIIDAGRLGKKRKIARC